MPAESVSQAVPPPTGCAPLLLAPCAHLPLKRPRDLHSPGTPARMLELSLPPVDEVPTPRAAAQQPAPPRTPSHSAFDALLAAADCARRHDRERFQRRRLRFAPAPAAEVRQQQQQRGTRRSSRLAGLPADRPGATRRRRSTPAPAPPAACQPSQAILQPAAATQRQRASVGLLMALLRAPWKQPPRCAGTTDGLLHCLV